MKNTCLAKAKSWIWFLEPPKTIVLGKRFPFYQQFLDILIAKGFPIILLSKNFKI